MSITQPPHTGDAALDSQLKEITDTINTLPVGTVFEVNNVISSTVPAAISLAGQDGINSAFITIYQRQTLNDVNGLTRPPRLTQSTRYGYNSQVLLAYNPVSGRYEDNGPWDVDLANDFPGWTQFLPERDPVLQDDYIWIQTVNVSDRATEETIASSEWSAVQLLSRPGIGALRALTSYEEVVEADQVAFKAYVNRLFLGEVEITNQIPDEQICWLISENDGQQLVDQQGFGSDAELASALGTSLASGGYSDRNFRNVDEGSPGARHVGYETTFLASEIFSTFIDESDRDSDISAVSVDEQFTGISREIEVRVSIDNVVYI